MRADKFDFLTKNVPSFTPLAPSEQGPCFSIVVFPERSPVPAQTLNKFMFSGQSEKLEVILILFREQRPLCGPGWLGKASVEERV